MPTSVFIMEGANLFAGDHDPSNSTHLVLDELKLPGLEEVYTDHNPGGAPIAVEVDTHIQRLEATFNLAGWNVGVMQMIGSSNRAQQIFTAYGAIRDRRLGVLVESKAVMQGRLGRVNPTPFRKGDKMGHEYSIRGIVHYELTMGDSEIYYWDFFESARRVGGVDLNETMNTILRIPPGA